MTGNASQGSLTDKPDDISNGRGIIATTQPIAQSPYINNETSSGMREGPRLLKRELFDRTESPILSQFVNGSAAYSAGPPFAQTQPLPHMPQQDAHSLPQVPSTSDRPSMASIGQSPSFMSVSSPSLWPAQQDVVAPRRPGPFDPNYPTSRNTVPVKPVLPIQPTTSQTGPVPPIVAPVKQSPWFTASQTVVGEGWGNESNSLTAANLGQHNKQQELEKTDHVEKFESQAPEPTPEPQPAALPQTPAEPVASQVATPLPTKSRRKQNAPAVAPVPAPVQLIPQPSVVSEPLSPKPPSPPPALAEAKSAWSIEEDKKPLSLREIQELELKKAEARKVADRERERSTRATAATAAASSPIVEDVQTISWGLPTSQAGTRPAKEAQLSSSPAVTTAANASSPPVWTNTAKAPVAKKSMKEIQEEEEKRKKLAAKDKETVAVAARRAYAESTNKVSC
jgi:PERQ amino acid-rich with GYF domain-containing protein